MLSAGRQRHVLIIVANLPVPLDRRVWLECQALIRAGYQVSVVCPKGPGDPARQVIDDVRIYKYRPAPEADGALSYVWEFVYSWLRTAVLSVVAWRRGRFHLLQACNPPDTFWLLATLWRGRGVRFVYDQHDLNPELFISRFGRPRSLARRMQYAGLCWLERRTYRAADRVISTNESYRRIALERGHVPAGSATVVRSGPDTQRMRPIRPDPKVYLGGTHLLVYLGIMGPQDGVHIILEVMEELVHRRGWTTLRAALLGFGDCLEDLKRQSTDMGLSDVVHFTGRVGPEEIAHYLSGADVGLCPDLKTPLNDVSTMNKVMEFMAYALPVVSFDLAESRVSAGQTAVFVPSGDVMAFADAVEALLKAPEDRARLGRSARERVSSSLDWRPQAQAYVGVYDGLVGLDRDLANMALAGEAHPADADRVVDLSDDSAFSSFLRTRGRQERS